MKKYIFADICYITSIIGFIVVIALQTNPIQVILSLGSYSVFMSVAFSIIEFSTLYIWLFCFYLWYRYDKKRVTLLLLLFLSLLYVIPYYFRYRIGLKNRNSRSGLLFVLLSVNLLMSNCEMDKRSLMTEDDLKWQIPSCTYLEYDTHVDSVMRVKFGEEKTRYGLFTPQYVNTIYSHFILKTKDSRYFFKYRFSKCNDSITFVLKSNGCDAETKILNDSVVCFDFSCGNYPKSYIEKIYIKKGVGVISYETSKVGTSNTRN